MSERLQLVPVTIGDAIEFIRVHHRHHKPPVSGLFAVAAALGGEVVGVAVVGRPNARMLQDGWTAEVTRLATDGSRNACSILYAAAWRACRALGYRRLVTYTLPEEGGGQLACGWLEARRRGWRWLVVEGFKAASRQTPDAGEVPMGDDRMSTEEKRRARARREAETGHTDAQASLSAPEGCAPASASSGIGFEELSGAVYLVGPMTGYPRLNWSAFLAVWKCFLERGRVLPSAPHLNECGVYGINEWLDAIDSGEIRLDGIDSDGFARSVRHILDVRPTLVALPDWRESEGTRAEVAVAKRLRLPVYEVVYEDGVPVGAGLVGEISDRRSSIDSAGARC